MIQPEEKIMHHSENPSRLFAFLDMNKFTIPSAVIAIILISVMQASAFVAIALKVKERAGVSRNQSLVTFGVPFAKTDSVMSTDNLKITASDGAADVPAQFRVLSRYQGAANDLSRPIRMVLVDFKASLDAGEEGVYYLSEGGNGTTAGNDIAGETASHISLNTGALYVKISKQNFNLFDEVSIDSDANGIADKLVVVSTASDGICAVYQGAAYTSAHAPSEISIEENGPLRAVVKVSGYLENNSGTKLFPPLADNGISYTVRVKAYKGKSYLKVDITLKNENQGWAYGVSDPVHNIFIDSCFVKTTLYGLDTEKTVRIASYEDTASTACYKLIQDEQSSGNTPAYDWQYIITKNEAAAATGEKFDSGASVGDDVSGLMAASRWFWQNYPQGIRIENNAFYYDMWPDIAQDYRLLGGIWKTHQLLYYFHQNDASFDDELADLKKPLIALASDEYYAACDFFSALPPAGVSSNYIFPAGEKMQDALDAQLKWCRAKFDDSYIESPYAPETVFSLRDKRTLKISDAVYGTWYGWLEFGDFVRGNGWGYSGLHYDWPYNSLKYLLQFGGYEVFDLSQELVNHQADILIIHDPKATEGYPDNHYHGGHRYENDALLSYHDDYSQGTNEPRYSAHFWDRGILLQYLLSGDERFREVARECAEHMSYVYVQEQEANMPENSYFAVRRFGRAIHALIGYYKVSGDAKYIDDALYIFEKGVLNCEHIVDGVRMGYLRETADEASALQTGINIEPAIELYDELRALNRTSSAKEISDFLDRAAHWFSDIIYKNWATADCGTYGTGENSGKYFPYGQEKIWYITDTKWPDGSYGNYYQPYAADLFAFQYVVSGQENWLNLARALIKDFYFYPLEGRYFDIVYAPKLSPGFFSQAGDAWGKDAQYLKKGLYYRQTEWNYSRGILPLTASGPPAPPSRLLVK